MPKIILTGGSGFLGTNLRKHLEGQEIETIPHSEIDKLKVAPFDRFFFLSSYGNLFNQQETNKIIKANVFDVATTIEKVSKVPFKSFVFISTSSVKLPIQTTYSRAKRAAEEILLAYMEKYKHPICIIRPYSITGVGEQEQHLIPVLIKSCFEGTLVNFDPKPTHDFIDVSDVCSAIDNLSSNSLRGFYEIGSGIKHTNAEVLQLVEELSERKANINEVNNYRPYDTDNWVSNNFKARGFGWLPKKTLKQSISEMIDDYVSKHA